MIILLKSIDLKISSIFFDLGAELPHWLVVFFASYLIWLIGIFVIVFLLMNPKKRTRVLANVVAAASFAYVINFLIGYFFFRSRPFVSLGISALIGTSHLDKSFPSDHTAVAFSIAMAIFLKNKKIGAIFLALALFVSIGRMLSRVHYLSDIIGGIAVAVFSAYAMKRLIKEGDIC